MTKLLLASLVVVGVVLATIGLEDLQYAFGTTIIKSPVVVAPLSDNDINADTYTKQLVQSIETAPTKKILIKWRGLGGAVFSGLDVIRAIQASQANGHVITIEITGSAYSMHALIPCFADNIIMDEGTFLMYHAPFMPGLLPGTKQFSSDPGDSAQNLYLFEQCVKKKILTEQEVQDILVQHKEVEIIKYKTLSKIETTESP